MMCAHIATIIVQCEGASTTADYLTLAAVLLVMIAIVYVTLRLAVPVARFLGDTGLTVATRLYGMLVIAIAIDMAIIGFGLLFPQLL
jgi:multiple antibiotic resistance protein